MKVGHELNRRGFSNTLMEGLALKLVIHSSNEDVKPRLHNNVTEILLKLRSQNEAIKPNIPYWHTRLFHVTLWEIALQSTP